MKLAMRMICDETIDIGRHDKDGNYLISNVDVFYRNLTHYNVATILARGEFFRRLVRTEPDAEFVSYDDGQAECGEMSALPEDKIEEIGSEGYATLDDGDWGEDPEGFSGAQMIITASGVYWMIHETHGPLVPYTVEISFEDLGRLLK